MHCVVVGCLAGVLDTENFIKVLLGVAGHVLGGFIPSHHSGSQMPKFWEIQLILA
jgi:uncharacterized membrane protein YeaQ/YmgE (transglycosylase-associated protein family)